MRPPRSLRWRLAIWLVLGVVFMWTASAVVTVNNMRREMGEVFDSALQETAQRLLPLAVMDIADRQEDGIARSVSTLHRHEEYFTYVVRNRQGRILLRSHAADDTIFPPFKKTGFVNSPTHRLYFDATLDGALTIAVAEPLGHREKVAREAFVGLAIPLAVLIPFSILAVWVLVQMSMRPLDEFRKGIEKRGSGDLAPVPVADLPKEMVPVADEVNHLLVRLRRTLEAERSFTSNSAHELRTPVAAALAQTQRLIAETKDAPTLDRAQKIEASLRRLARLSEKLMQLAKAEGGSLISATEHDLRPIVAMVIDELSTAGDTAHNIRFDKPATAVKSHVDLDAFAILARNLIENAMKHGGKGDAVVVKLSPDGTFSVINSGAIVPPMDLNRLTRTFERGPTEADGTGLGLAIARTIAAGAGGRLVLKSPASGREDGFEGRFIPKTAT